MSERFGDVALYRSFRDTKGSRHFTLGHAVDPVQQENVAVYFGQFCQGGQTELQGVSCSNCCLRAGRQRMLCIGLDISLN